MVTLSLSLLLVLAAFVCAIASTYNRCPLWVAVLLLCVAHLVGVLPR